MYALATSKITVTRGTTVDQFGDKTAGTTVVYQGVADIQHKTNRYFDQATQTPRTVQDLDMAVANDADVRPGDFVLDTTFNVNYVVGDVTQPFGPLILGDKVCSLKRVN